MLDTLGFTRWAVGAVVAAFGLFGCEQSQAQALPSDPVPRVVVPRTVSGNVFNTGVMTADASNAAKYSFGVAANGSVFANVGAELPTAGGKSIPLSVIGQVSKPGVTAAIGRFLGRALPVVSTGVAFYDLLNDLDIAVNGPCTDSENFCGVKKNRTKNGIWEVRGNNNGTGSSFEAAANMAYAGSNFFTQYRCTQGPPNPVCSGWHVDWWYGIETYYHDAPDSISYSPVTKRDVVAAVDGAVGAPGVAPTPNVMRAFVDAVKTDPVGVKVYPRSVTGPAQGTPETVTVTDPATGVQTVTEQVPKYSYAPSAQTVPDTRSSNGYAEPVANYNTYEGPKITTSYTTNVSTTNINNPSAPPVPVSTTEATKPPAEAQPTLCDLYPDSIMCSVFGDPPETPAIPRQDIPVTYTPLTFAGAGSCPSDVPFTIFGKAFAIPWTPACDLMRTLAPIFLALGAAAAALIFMEGLKA